MMTYERVIVIFIYQFFLSCHCTLFIHWKTHSFSASLYSITSTVVHFCGSIGHFNRCYIVCVFSPQSHMVSASLFGQLFGLFIHFQCNHGASDPGTRSSDIMNFSFCGTAAGGGSIFSVVLLEGFHQVV